MFSYAAPCRTKDKEYGVSRGVDFQNVCNVINFDFPTTVESYIHRVGRSVWFRQSHISGESHPVVSDSHVYVFFCFFARRTARADNPGTALSFIGHTELELLSEVEEALAGGHYILLYSIIELYYY